jgi:hypothetical protein
MWQVISDFDGFLNHQMTPYFEINNEGEFTNDIALNFNPKKSYNIEPFAAQVNYSVRTGHQKKSTYQIFLQPCF